jgi:hypothetical protein
MAEREQALQDKMKAEEALNEAQKYKELAEQRYQEVIRLSDIKRLNDLQAEEEELWPALPENIPKLEDWLQKAVALTCRLEIHMKSLEALREKALPMEEGKDSEGTWKYEDAEKQWQHDCLVELVEGLKALNDEKNGAIKRVKDRLVFTKTVEQQK